MTNTLLPLTPTDCDLRDFAFMPLDVLRLRDSDLAIQVSGEEFRCAVLLWCASWHQIPAASLPDDDITLSSLAGYGRAVDHWRTVRANALHGWIKCSDGRLYHPVVAEKAGEAWKAKLQQRWKTECARIKKFNQRHEANHVVPEFDEWMSLGCPQGQQLSVPRTMGTCPEDNSPMSQGQPSNVPETKGTCPASVLREMHSKGQGQGQLKEKDIPAAASLAHTPAHEHDPTPPPLDGDKTPEEKTLAVAVWLRRREKARGKQPRGTQANDPRIAAWIEAGATGLQLAEAYDLAVLDRDATGDPGPIGPGFLDIFVAKVLHPPAANSAVNCKRPSPADPLAWATTASGIEAKGAELGIVQEASEIFPAFKARVHAAAGTTDADRARLLADCGVRV